MIQKILDQLDKVQKRGANRWMACCPAHEDRTPSLALQQLSDGRILMKCFAGCGTDVVMASMGLTMDDLFPDGALGEFKGWEQLQREMRQRKEQKSGIQRDREILEIANSMRRQGERLSPKDLERERQAYLRVKNADNN